MSSSQAKEGVAGTFAVPCETGACSSSPWSSARGTRLFPDTGRDRALELVESRATPSGRMIQVYRRTGRPQYATATK